MKKNLLVLTHPDEWNQSLPFNGCIQPKIITII